MCIVAHHTSLSGMLNADNYCAQPRELLQELKEIVLLNPYTILEQSEGHKITFLLLAKV